jgi:hypothetical protein
MGRRSAKPIYEAFEGKGELLVQGKRRVEYWSERGATAFLVCLDADDPSPEQARLEAERSIMRPDRVIVPLAIVVPVQAIEAWILADLPAVGRVFGWKSWNPPDIPSPESVDLPKKRLRQLSKDHRGRPRYNPVAHNPKVARELDLERVRSKCPSFQGLVDFVKKLS